MSPIDPRKALTYLKPMAIREILKLPDPLLKKVSKSVDKVTPEILNLWTTCWRPCTPPRASVSLPSRSACRSAWSLSTPPEDEAPKNPLYFINPEIVWTVGGLNEHEEGCLSIPEVFDMVKRPAEVRSAISTATAVEQEMHCDGLLATCIQHEIDHLNGVLFIDRLGRLKRDRVVKKFAKSARREKAEA